MTRNIKKAISAVLTAAVSTAHIPSTVLAQQYSYIVSANIADGVLNTVVSASSEVKEVSCYIAEYSESGELISISKNIEIHSGENTFEQILNKETYKISVFLWNEMQPITEKLTLFTYAEPAESAQPTESVPSAEPTLTPEPTADVSVTPPVPSDKPEKTSTVTIQFVDEENNKLKDDMVFSETYQEGDIYTVPESLKNQFAVKTDDGLYNLYEFNEGTSQQSTPFADEITLKLTFNSGVQYNYYEDFENYTVVQSDWKLGDKSPYPAVETSHTKYLKHTTTTTSTGTYTNFKEPVDTTEKIAEITADVMFTKPTDAKLGQFAISNTDPAFSSGKIHWGVENSAGHILVMQYSEGKTFKINNTDITDICEADKWLNIKAEANFSTKKINITVTNESGKSKTFEDSFFSSSVKSNIGSIYLRSPSTNGTVNVDNLAVRITGNAGPVEPNVKSPLNSKSVYAFGDSIVYGHNAPAQSFMRLIADDYSMDLNMMAKNGATIMQSSNHILTQIKNAPSMLVSCECL